MKNEKDLHRFLKRVFCILAEFAFLSILSGQAMDLLAVATGGQVAELLSYGAGGRALGMGGAFVSVADDASSTYWNPAGMPQLTRKELTLLQSTLFGDTTFNFYSYVQPSKKGNSAWGISLVQLASSGFERVSAILDPNTNTFSSVNRGGGFAVSETAYGFSYGRKVVDHVSIGTTIRQYTRAVDSSSDSSMLADLGALMDFKNGERRVGLTIADVYAKTSGDTSDSLPLVLRLGISDQYFKKRLLLSVDYSKNFSQTTNGGYNMGGEFGFTKNFKGRFGIQGDQGEGLRETDVGFGYTFHSLTFDYALGLGNALGTANRISITLKFGRSVMERREENIHKLVQKAFAAVQNGNYLVAQEQLQAALDVDPSDKNVQMLVEKFQRVVSAIPSAMGNEEPAVFIRRGILSYANGDMKAAIAALRQAYYKDPKNDKLLSLLNKLESDANMEKTEAPKGPELFTPIDQKVFDARQAILQGKYDVAIKKCQDILDLNPNDITALKIMGSAFFLLDDHTRARKLWTRVLEIDPTDKEIPEFIKQLRPE